METKTSPEVVHVKESPVKPKETPQKLTSALDFFGSTSAERESRKVVDTKRKERSEEAKENGGTLTNEDEESLHGKEKRRKENKTLNGRETEQPSKRGKVHSSTPQLEVKKKKTSPEKKKGEENCLEVLTFVATGVLESVERDDTADLIQRYGGKVTDQSVSKKTSYIVVGQGAGDSKLSELSSAVQHSYVVDDELVKTKPVKTKARKKISYEPSSKEKKSKKKEKTEEVEKLSQGKEKLKGES
ncbi:replication factor C subunit 1-like [Orbicella faveolata]|uniref:replication factor C subunit 1-like n=1 Tax=Orbicella faveolata TaxID=48498 RepID=UPI0009E34CF4|nr:replication factor C subunit 1-like [Orbicella faveolata]